MKTIVEIDGDTYVVPQKFVGTLANIFSQAVKVSWDYKSHTSGSEYEYFVDGPVKIEIKQVPDRNFKRRPPKPGEADIEGPMGIEDARPTSKKILRLPAQQRPQKLLGI